MAGVISTPHTLATEAGMQMFRAGGNAVDAALAAAAVLTVVYPHQCALGGDAFALVESASGDVTAYNGSGAAPAGLDADLLSRVELDQFDTTFKPALEARGYASVYKKRPRAVSCDGSKIPE